MSHITSTGVSKDTAAGDMVSVSVSADGPYGVMFEADQDGHAAVVKAFDRLPNGKFGPIQKHGGIHIGDVMYAINDSKMDVVAHREVMQIVRDRNLLKKTFKFMNVNEYYRKKKSKERGSLGGLSLGGEHKPNAFMSKIKQTRLSQDTAGHKFTEYEVACQWRVMSMRVHKENVYKWSVWKRYNEFDTLNNILLEELGWLMEGTEFPPPQTMVFNKLSAAFVESRREALNTYWQHITGINKGQLVEFGKHHCSQALKTFLDVDGAVASGAGMKIGGGFDDGSRAGPDRRSSTTASTTKAGAAAARRRQSAAGAAGASAFAGDHGKQSVGARRRQSAAGSGASPASASASYEGVSVKGEGGDGKAPPPRPPPPPSAAPTPAPASSAVPEHLAKYSKMQKMGLPEAAVRLKMSQEGVKDSEIDSFFGGGSGGAAPPPRTKAAPASGPAAAAPPPAPAAAPARAPAPAPAPAAAEADPALAKYSKMQKMGLPEAAVRLKMSQEGISDEKIDSFFKGGTSGGGGGSGGAAGPPEPMPRPPAGGGMAALLGGIQKGAKLKKCQTNDRSQVKNAGAVV